MSAQLDPEPVDRRIAELAASQHGVVSRAQLRELGLGRHQVGHRLRLGRLQAIHRGVYAVGHGLLGYRGRWLAAVMACGDRAVLSHRTAAAVWDLRAPGSGRMDVTVSRSGRRAPTGVLLHRSRTLPTSETVTREGIPVTTVARTLLDLAAVVSPDELRRAAGEAERLRIFDLRAIKVTLDRHAGRAGTQALVAVIDHWTEPALTRTELERLFLAVCTRHDLPRPLVNSMVAGYEVDFLWPSAKVIVEADGRETHLTSTAFEADRERDARLTALGYRVIRFTYRQVLDRPDLVEGILKELLAQPARSISSTR